MTLLPPIYTINKTIKDASIYKKPKKLSKPETCKSLSEEFVTIITSSCSEVCNSPDYVKPQSIKHASDKILQMFHEQDQRYISHNCTSKNNRCNTLVKLPNCNWLVKNNMH